MNEVVIKGGQLLLSLSILFYEFTILPLKCSRSGLRNFSLLQSRLFSFQIHSWETEYGWAGFRWVAMWRSLEWLRIHGQGADENASAARFAQACMAATHHMLGGIIMNVLLGIFIYWMILFFNGEHTSHCESHVRYAAIQRVLHWDLKRGHPCDWRKAPGKLRQNLAQLSSTWRVGYGWSQWGK